MTGPATASSLGIALSTVRPDEAVAFVASVLRQSVRPGCISVRHQGPPEAGVALGQRLDDLAAESRYDGLVVGSATGRGASRGRNAAIHALPGPVTWVWTPNDTSRPPPDWATVVAGHLAALDESVAAVAMDYRVDGRLRRHVSGVPLLTGWSLWRALEAAVVWRRKPLLDVGGFDEMLGTGADGWAQSGECTDLLCRLRDAGYAVATAPLEVEGPPQHVGSTGRDARRKEFYYGVGFGCVARRHFSLGRSVVSVVSPVASLVTGRAVEGQRLSPLMSLTAFAGRGTGLLLGERSVQLRMRGSHWA